MTEPLMPKLEELSDKVTTVDEPERKIEALKKAFDLFSVETTRLERSYKTLKEQSHQINLELEATNNYLYSILDNMVQGLLFINMEGHVKTYNPTAERLLSADRKTVLNQPYSEHFPDDLLGFSVEKAISELQGPSTSYATLEKSDHAYHIEVSTTFVESANPESQGLIILLRDITQLRHLRVLANRNNRMKELGEMAAAVAHEIRNPLGGIKGFASLLHRDLADKPELQSMTEYIISGTETLDRLVTDVLNYSRPLTTHFEAKDLVQLLQASIAFANADTNINKKLDISFESSETGLTAAVDIQMLQGVFLNLITNSAQAMKEGSGSLTITIEQQKGNAIITMCDNGCGIPEENLEKIFSPFFTTKTKGNGLGLSEVYKIIRAHGGDVSAKSTVGVGTRFMIKLPIKLSPSKTKV
jgi:PAS domain S-box-containing protein